nr:hypothetical protein [Dehalococcoidia bacterium]
MGAEPAAGEVGVGASLTGLAFPCFSITHIELDMGPGYLYSLLIKDPLDSSPQFAH